MSAQHRGGARLLLDAVAPNAACDSPTSNGFPTTLNRPPLGTSTKLLSMARAACAKADVIRRMNASLTSKSWAPMTADTTPLRMQSHCRGEPLLYAAGGVALAPFGPGLRHCRANSVCWFALADCGTRGGAALDGLQLRTRFVSGTAIFAPHVAFVPLGEGGLLFHWFCPPAAGNFSLDARLMWFATDADRVRRDGPAGARLLDENRQAWAGLQRPVLSRPGAKLASGIRPSIKRGGVGVGGGGGRGSVSGRGRGGRVTFHSHVHNMNGRLPHQHSASTAAGRRLEPATAATAATRLNVFLGGREPRCPRGHRCQLDFDTAAYRALSRRCDGESALGGVSAAPLVTHVVEDHDGGEGPRRPLAASPPACTLGEVGSDGYWADSSAPFAPRPFAPTPLPAEERAHGRWVWANRGCKRTHLTRESARRCLADAGRMRIHLHGDSQSRDLYVALAQFLGLPVLAPDEMKKRTNVLGVKRHGTGEATLSLTQGYTWGAVQHPILLSTEVAEVDPHVVVTNFALAHAPLVLPALQDYMDKWVAHWKSQFMPHTSRTPPPILIFQRAGAFEAARGYGPLGLQAQDELIWRALRPLGFVALDTLVPHASRFDATDDGAHVLVNGTTMLGIVTRLLELACRR